MFIIVLTEGKITKMKKIFKVAQIKDLLNQVYNEEITFSRFVEILNEHASRKRDNVNVIKKKIKP